MEVCNVCGLPKDLCVCQAIASEDQQITIRIVKRRFGKLTTLIEGLDEKRMNLKALTKALKTKLACGGTVKNSVIELQGNHVERVKKELINLDFKEDSITVKQNVK